MPSGRHFLQIPGPTNVPDRILRAIDQPTIDHRGPEFQALARETLQGLKSLFGCSGPVVVYPASGTGAWEAALANTCSPGETVLMAETGHFANLWKESAERFGLNAEIVPGDWRRGADISALEEQLQADKGHRIKAVCLVHNETSTGAVSHIDQARAAMDRAGHPALLMVDTVSSLGCIDYRHDEWGVDVTVSGSQKGMMLPPGMSFNAVSEKALEASKSAKLPRAFFAWDTIVKQNENGMYPYTPATNIFYGLAEALKIFSEEGLENIFARHIRHGEAARRAVQAWGLELQCEEPADYSPALTTVRMPDGHDADRFRAVVLENFNMSLGAGLSKLAGKVFRIGHLGDFNDLMLAGALSGVEMGLELAGVPYKRGGVQAALDYLSSRDQSGS